VTPAVDKARVTDQSWMNGVTLRGSLAAGLARMFGPTIEVQVISLRSVFYESRSFAS
jgi:hypothetical protein